MPITYPINMPSLPGLRRVVWSEMSAVQGQMSEFTFNRKVYEWQGQIRYAEVEVAPMPLALARAWVSWKLKLNGKANTFYFSDPTFVSLGVAGAGSFGTPLVKGGGQTGQDLITDGWTPSTTNMLKEGDILSIGDRLYNVLQDVSTNDSGEATFSVWPDLRGNIADNAPISLNANARGVFCLEAFPEMAFDEETWAKGFSFTAHEAL